MVDVKPYPTGTHPWVRRLTDHDSVPESANEVWDLLRAGAVVPEPGWHEIWAVRRRRRDSDWTQAGFSKLFGSAAIDLTHLPRVGYIGIDWHEINTAVIDGRNQFDGLYMGESDDADEYLAGWLAHIEANHGGGQPDSPEDPRDA